MRFMNLDKSHIKEKLVVVLAWLWALSMVYLVYIKFRMLFH